MGISKKVHMIATVLATNQICFSDTIAFGGTFWVI